MKMNLPCCLALLVLVPALVLGAPIQPSHSGDVDAEQCPLPLGHGNAPQQGDRGTSWVFYDAGGSWGAPGGGGPATGFGAYGWNPRSAFYQGNIFWPKVGSGANSWYPYTINTIACLYWMINGAVATGTAGPMEIFNSAGTVIGALPPVVVPPLTWVTLPLAVPAVVATGPVVGAAWFDYTAAGVGDRPVFGATLFGTVGGIPLWPPPYPAGTTLVEPYLELWQTAATPNLPAGWVWYTQPGGAANKAAFFRVLMSGLTVPVEMLSFEGRARRGYVLLSWATASEEDNLGFNVYRSATENGQYVRVNGELIPGHGTTLEGHDYSFADYGVQASQKYYYKIEDVAADGSSSMHGPIAVPIGADFVSSWGAIKAAFN